MHFDGFWLNALFPSLEAIDRARFPVAEQLETELGAAGFGDVRLTRLSQESTRSTATARSSGSAASTSRPSTCSTTTSTPRASSGPSASFPERVDYRLEWLLAAAVRSPV